jgi:hypothetical protein
LATFSLFMENTTKTLSTISDTLPIHSVLQCGRVEDQISIPNYNRSRGSSILSKVFIWLVLILSTAVPLFAQAPSPTPMNPYPTPTSTGAKRMTDVARGFIPTVKKYVEERVLVRYTWLATIFAQLIMAASLLKLMADRMSPAENLFRWGGRCMIFLPLILTGPMLISYLYKVGYALTTPLVQPMVIVRQSFEERYEKWVQGHFMADNPDSVWIPGMGNGSDVLIGVLSSNVNNNVRSIEKLSDENEHNMKMLFSMISWARAIISFSEFLLLIITGLLIIAFRLAVPWMIAVAIDKSLANEITYRFARGVIVYTLVFPVVSTIMRFVAYLFGLLGMASYDHAVFKVAANQLDLIMADPTYNTTFTIGAAGFMMLVTSLCLVASPVISWKIAFGQTFEGLTTVASGWMAAIVGSGINLVSAQVGAHLNSAAERLQVDANANAGIIQAQAETGYTKTLNAIAATKEIVGFNAGAGKEVKLNNANTQQAIQNIYAGVKQEIAGYGVNRDAANKNIETDQWSSNAAASVENTKQTGFTQLEYDLDSRMNYARTAGLATEGGGAVLGSIIGARGVGQGAKSMGAANGAGKGQQLGSLAGKSLEVLAENLNITDRKEGVTQINNQALMGTVWNNDFSANVRQGTENQRFDGLKSATEERGNTQVGAARTWNQQANNAATQYASTMSDTSQSALRDMNIAADAKLGESIKGIETVRSAGMTAAEYHRQAHILSQITHDITRRIEEMGAYRF